MVLYQKVLLRKKNNIVKKEKKREKHLSILHFHIEFLARKQCNIFVSKELETKNLPTAIYSLTSLQFLF